MESLFLQNVRYKLQKRVRRLNGADFESFLFLLKAFWVFFDDSPLLTTLAQELVAKVPEYVDTVGKISTDQIFFGSNETESAAIGYGVLRKLAGQDRPDALFNFCAFGECDKVLDQFRTLYLEPFYEYLDEHLDDRLYVLHSLLRYKQACEWFRRKDLFEMAISDTKHGERRLAFNLYEYLHERGLDFSIEPTSASGEADMVAIQQDSREPLIADAKILNPEASKGKSYLIRSFHQVYQYTCDYNEPIGYLIFFNMCDRRLRFLLKEASDPVPRVVYNHKTIFLLEIDIYPHAEPASKRGKPDSIDVTEEDLTASVES
ncbi:MAG: hypothetical protein ABSB35_06130 [Bryobacteraceae bacterium]|jgi:hypothetical protein